MIVLLELIIGASAYIVGSFIESVGPQVARRWIPSQTDKAQMANVELRRQEISAQESRFLRQIAETRQLKMDELEKMRQNRREEADYNEQLRRWPLRTLPHDILARSKFMDGKSLNVLLAVVDNHETEFYKTDGKPVSKAIDLLNSSPMHNARDVMNGFNDDIIFYSDTLKGSRLTGNSLITTLWNPLQTEPTILIEINILSPDRYRFEISNWGGTFNPDGSFVSRIKTFSPLLIDLSSLPPEADVQRRGALALGLSSMLASLGDAYRTLHRPHEFPTPMFPMVMKNAAAASLPDGIWKPMTKAYLSTYDGVAMHSPIIASELAARAALAAHEANQSEFAADLLNKSLQVHPTLRNAAAPETLMWPTLIRQRKNSREPSNLESALITLRGLPAGNSSMTQSVDEMMRSFRPKRDTP